MGEYDATTWQAIGITLTVVGLVLSFLAWRSRGAAAGLRGVAWSLLPLAAAMTGLLRVVFEVTESVYQALRERYVFQLRGHHYLEGLGEFSTYLLGGRL